MSESLEPASSSRGSLLLESVVVSAWLLLLYAKGACPSVYVGDSGELVTAVHTLGIPHPSGYPLYVLAGKLWTLVVRWGSVAHRISLFSAVFAAASVALLYGVSRRLRLHPVAALFGAGLLAVSPSFWGEANVQRVYSLNAFFVVASLGAFLEWRRSRDRRWLAGCFLLCGLGATNHTFMAAQALAIFAAALIEARPEVLRAPLLARITGAFLIGLVPYVYLPLRSRDDPSLDWGNPETLSRFLGVVLRFDYWDQAWVKVPFDLARVVADYLWSLGPELIWVGAALALWGALAGRRRGWPILVLLFIMAGNLAALAAHGSRSDLFLWHRYYIPSYAMASLLAAFGCELLLARLPKPWKLAPLVVPIAWMVLRFPDFDRSRYRVAEDFGRKLLASLPEGAQLSASGDNVLFPLLYLHWVEGLRPDVSLILQASAGPERVSLSFDPDEDALFFTHHPNWRGPDLEVVPAGLAFRIVRAGSPRTRLVVPTGGLEGETDPDVPRDYLTRSLIGHYHYMLGATYADIDWARAEKELRSAAEAASDDDVLFYNLGLLYSRKGLYVEAYDAFRRSHAINPRPLAGTPSASAARRIDEVRRELESIAAIEPSPAGERPPPSAPRPPLVHGRELDLLHAIGRFEQDSLRVLATPKGARARAFVSGVEFPASRGDYVEIDVDAPPDVELFFLWSTEEDPTSVHGLPLPRGWSAATTIHLGAEAEWRGRIDGIGVGWTGPSRDPFEIRTLRLRSNGALASLWDEWTGFEGLSGHSMNFVIGGPRLSSRYLRPVPTLGLSLLAALAGYGLACRWRRRRIRLRVVMALGVGAWLAADVRWKADLWRQLRLTQDRYAGKSWQEKRLSAEDGELFRFAMDVKAVLPQAPQVIFLVTRDPEGADRYLALRSRYHLLPHNVNSNYWHPPGPSEIRAGQYVLVFGPRPDVRYDEPSRRLRWSPDDGIGAGTARRELEVEPVFSSSLATLYRKL